MAAPLKLVSITNCQGPVLLNRFLGPGSAAFRDRIEVLDSIQVQNLRAADAERVRERIREADVLLVQPVFRNPVAEVTHAAVMEQAGDRRVISFPALHFDCLLGPIASGYWRGRPGHPLTTFEDVTLAAAWYVGLAPAAAARAYHEVPTIPQAQLEAAVARNIAGFTEREKATGITVAMSDFYEAEWSRQRLHFIKSHPMAVVYAELARRVARHLGVEDVEPDGVPDFRGNDIVSLPLKRWLLEGLGCTLEDDPAAARSGGRPLAFETMIERLWAFYADAGREAVGGLKGQNPRFQAICDLLSEERAQV